MERPSEVTQFHTRLMKSALEVDHCRAYWQHAPEARRTGSRPMAEMAFSEYWFGARSMARVEMLLADFRERFDAFPPAMEVLHRWHNMDAITRRVICHWHLQLADRLYREFTGVWLVDRRSSGRGEASRDVIVRWIEQVAPGRWALSTRIQFARKLLYSATEAGLLDGSRRSRQLQLPRVDDDALTYILYLLWEVHFDGSLLENPYLASVGLSGKELERRLRTVDAFRFRKQGDLVEFGWQYGDLLQWAEASIPSSEWQVRGTA